MLTRRLLILTAVMTLGACSLDKQSAPPLAGPSELGLSLTISATPDIITQDGRSQATVEVLARDASSQPVKGLTLRAQTSVDGQATDFGTLSSKIASTGADGVARFTYLAPPAPGALAISDAVVTIEVEPVGTNYEATVTRYVSIRLMRPGTIIAPGGGPIPSFFFSPNQPTMEDNVFFDASASTGSIVNYAWSFGDGDSESSSSPTVRHRYDFPGSYNVVLTITDSFGRKSSSAPTPVRVDALTAPTAAFVISPTGALMRVGQPLSFNASTSTAALGRRIVSYSWDFGDLTPLVDTGNPIVQKAYGLAGNFVVVLIVTDDVGRQGKVTQSVTIAP